MFVLEIMNLYVVFKLLLFLNDYIFTKVFLKYSCYLFLNIVKSQYWLHYMKKKTNHQ